MTCTDELHLEELGEKKVALFCCILCLTGGEWMFYLSAGIWMASDFCALPAYTGRYE